MDKRLKIFYDSEFTGLTRDTDPISVGFVTETGVYFYAEFNDYDHSKIDDWLQEHIINNLMFNDTDAFYERLLIKDDDEVSKSYHVRMKGTKSQISNKLLEWLINESTIANMQIQIYCDCYAYDWMIFNELVCEDGNALSIPKCIDYIPIDLSTELFVYGYDPDVTREDLVDEEYKEQVKALEVFSNCNPDSIKHNSLWDAIICMACFAKLSSMKWETKNHRVYDINTINNSDVNVAIGDKKFIGEIEHPSN